MTQAATADLYLLLIASSLATYLGIVRLMIVGGGGARGSEFANTNGDSLMQEVVKASSEISRLTA